MIFNSVTYLVFLAAVVAGFWVLPRRARLALLCAASLAFYAFWRVDFAALMIFSATLDFVVARRMESADGHSRRRWLLVSIVINLALLAYFKYLLFALDSLEVVARIAGLELALPHPEIVLPLGISFYTFQTIGYTIDVYRRAVPAERDYLLYIVFVTYFPQLVAGPILRAGELVHQLARSPRFDPARVLSGLRWIVCGLAMKVLLADNVAGFVDDGFAQPTATLGAIDVLTLSFLFGFQIYFDFAAYSQIALGSARLMGVEFPANFLFPYLARSPREFWRRWHISLSSWIRDYLYLPLIGAVPRGESVGGLAGAVASADGSVGSTPARGVAGRGRAWAALFATWLIMGLWHGAGWNFVLWGAWHAVLIAAYRLGAPIWSRLPGAARSLGGWTITLPLVMLSWVAFRADSASQAFALYGRLLDPGGYLWLGMRENAYLVAATLLAGFLLVAAVHRAWPALVARAFALATLAEGVLLGSLLALLFVFLRPVEQFIYFQF